jgi:hypothetical protein
MVDHQNMTELELIELINRRRRQILVFSCVYYVFNDNLVSDQEYDLRVRQLMELQDEYPWIASKCIYQKEFEKMDGCGSGYSLSCREPWVINKALQLIRYNNVNQPSTKVEGLKK